MPYSLHLRRGSLCLDGDEVSAKATKYLQHVPLSAQSFKSKRDGANNYHITVVTPQEADKLAETGTTIPLNLVEGLEIFDLGLSHVEKASLEGWYIVIYCPALQHYRKLLGLPEKDFHITVGFHKQDLMSCGSILDYSFQLLDYLYLWAEIPKLFSIVSYICNQSKVFNLNGCPILFPQVRLLLESVTYYLLKSSSHNNLEQSSLSPANFVMKSSQCQELLKMIGRYCTCYAAKTNAGTNPSAAPYLLLLEDIGWYFFSEGFLIGLKFLWSGQPYEDVFHGV